MELLINNGNIAPSFFYTREKLLRAFLEKRVDVTISGKQIGCDEFIKDYGLKYRYVDVDRTGTNLLKDVVTIIDYIRLCRKYQYDIVFSYTVKPNIYGSIGARIAGIKRIYPTVNGLGYAFTDSGKITIKQKAIKRINIYLYRIAFTCSKKVFFQNWDDAEELIQYHAVPRNKCIVVSGSGIDLEKYNYAPLKNTDVFLFASRLLLTKGIRTFLEAAKRIKREYPLARFLVAGSIDSNPDSISKNELETAVSEGTIEYLGHVSNMKEKLEQCSVFVLPSYYREGVPHAVLEAMSVGRAIITCNTPGCKDTISAPDEHGKGRNGFLIGPKDSEALYSRMKWLLNHPDSLEAMGIESRKYAKEVFDVNIVNSIILNEMEIFEGG
ncbi:glycosyltransferase family 4 protein [Pseudobutyrivibrio sp.]|uniref:glycosyltransferase family 4 protein n=1 Tax=Pseudobutyrivibrio sp. TaxID=2014367 RepID=UPI0038707282